MNKFRKAISATLIASIMTPSLVVAHPVIPTLENTTIVQALQSQSVANSVEDGVYTAPVEVAHASNPGQKSMANGAIVPPAKLIYSGDKVTIELTFKGLKLYGMSGHLTSLFFYKENKDPLNNGEAIKAEVVKKFQDTGLDGNEYNFPQVFRYTIDKSLFENSEFLWCKVWVDAMDALQSGEGNPIIPGSGEQNAKIVIDKTKFTKVILNTQDLSNAIKAAKEIVKGKKTDEAFNTLKAAIAAAEEALNSASEPTAIDEAATTLKAAVEAFNNSPDKEASSELVKYVKLNVEDGGPTDPKIRNILDDYAEIVKINEKTYLRLTYFSLEKRSNGLDYGTKQLKYSYDESGEKIEAIGKVIESGQNAGEYELSQIDIPIDGKSEVYLFGEFMASIHNNNKIPGKAIVRFEVSDRNEKSLGNIGEFIVSQKGFTQKEGTEKLEFDVEKDGKIYTPYTSLEKGKFKIINHGSSEVAIKIKRDSFLLGDLRHIKYTLDGTEPTAESKEAGLRNENKPAIGFDKYYAIYLPYEDVESLKETGGDIKVRFKGFDKDFAQSTESKEITVSFSKEAYDELGTVKDETNKISFKADSSREFCFNSTTTLKVENINDSEQLTSFKKLAEDQGLSDVSAYKLSFVDNNETAKLDIDKSWDSEKFPLIKIKVEKEGADRNYYKNTAFYEAINGKLVQLPYNYLIKKVSIKNPDSIYVMGQKNYDTQLQEAESALQDKMNQIETNVTGNSLAEINLKNLLEKAKNLRRKTLNNILELNYQIDRNFEIINEGNTSDSEINKELAKELVKCINSDIYKEIFTKDFYNQVAEIKNELENKLQSGADLKDDLLKLDNLFKDPKYALPYKVTSVEIKRQDRDEPSMAGGCFMEEGKILYGKDENYLLLNLKTMSPGFLNAHLLELSVFKDRIDEDKLDVMSIYKYSDVMSGSSKLGIFDKQILVKLPKIEKDTYFIRVANDGMQGAAPGARLKFTAKGGLIEDEPQAPLQKEALTKEITDAKAIAQGKKTEEAFNTLKAAIASAEKVLGEAIEQTQLDEAVTTLKAAVKAFNESTDKVAPTPLEKEALTKEIAEAKKVEQGKKTDEAFAKLKEAIKAAEEALNSASEQTAIDEAVTTLKAAVETFKNSPDVLQKEALTKEIAAAKDIVKGNKKVEEFNILQSVITEAEKVLKEAADQESLDKEVKTLKAAVEAFIASEDVKLPAEDGIYLAPVEIGHASNPGQKSMANGAIEPIAKLILKEGKVKVELTFKGLDLNGKKGHLTNLFTFENNQAPKAGGQAVETKVEKKFMDMGMDGQNGEFPQVFSFTMDKNLLEASEFIWCRVWVDIMDGFMGGPGKGAQEARIIIDKEHLTKVVLNTEALTNEIEVAKKVEQGKKTGEAFSKLQAAITAAEKVLGEATEQTQLDEAVKALKTAVEAFNNSPNALEKEALTKEIAEAKKVEQGKKTDEAFNTLKAAITSAEKVLGEATEQTQLDEAASTLKAAVKTFNDSEDKVVPTPLEKEALTKEIAEAKKVEQGKKTDEAFNTLKAAITSAEETLKNATEQTQLDEAVTTLKAAVKTFNESADKVEPQPGPTPQPEPKPEPKPNYPSYPIYPWYNQSNKVSTSKTNKNTEIKKQEVKEEPKKQEVKKENLNKGRFTDINSHWAKEAINYVFEKGYFAGVSATEFAPDKSITRGEFVTVLGRMLKIDTSKYSSQRFNDVNSFTYYSPYITWANEVGIVSGVGEGNFAPDKALTREEMAVIMSKFLKLSNKKPTVKLSTNFKDQGSISPWAKEAVTEMAKLGVVKGMGEGNFSPKTEFTRAQVAQVLYSIENN